MVDFVAEQIGVDPGTIDEHIEPNGAGNAFIDARAASACARLAGVPPPS